jgi:hypothetical protein
MHSGGLFLAGKIASLGQSSRPQNISKRSKIRPRHFQSQVFVPPCLPRQLPRFKMALTAFVQAASRGMDPARRNGLFPSMGGKHRERTGHGY